MSDLKEKVKEGQKQDGVSERKETDASDRTVLSQWGACKFRRHPAPILLNATLSNNLLILLSRQGRKPARLEVMPRLSLLHWRV